MVKVKILSSRGHQELDVQKQQAIEIALKYQDYFAPIVIEKGTKWDLIEDIEGLILVPRLMGGSSPPSSIFFIPVTFQNIKKSYYFYSSKRKDIIGYVPKRLKIKDRDSLEIIADRDDRGKFIRADLVKIKNTRDGSNYIFKKSGDNKFLWSLFRDFPRISCVAVKDIGNYILCRTLDLDEKKEDIEKKFNITIPHKTLFVKVIKTREVVSQPKPCAFDCYVTCARENVLYGVAYASSTVDEETAREAAAEIYRREAHVCAYRLLDSVIREINRRKIAKIKKDGDYIAIFTKNKAYKINLSTTAAHDYFSGENEKLCIIPESSRASSVYNSLPTKDRIIAKIFYLIEKEP